MPISRVFDVADGLPTRWKLVGGSVIAGVVLVAAWKIRNVGKKNYRKRKYPRDTVILHQIGRGPYVPSLVPFAIKLETYLRMNKIPYENVHNKNEPSSKKKMPWIEYNGEAVADSEFILEFLCRERSIDMYKGLTPEQIGVGRAFQKMFEENTYWCMLLDRGLLDENETGFKELGLNIFMRYLAKRSVRKSGYSQGMGRHTKTEVQHIMSKDLNAFSYYLGSKKFIFGDKPNKFDCAIFGILAEIRWASFGGFGPRVIKEYSNLYEYCERMKETFWLDWEEVTKKGVDN